MAHHVHCRPCPGGHLYSYFFIHPDYIITTGYPAFIASSRPPDEVPAAARRRRRLDDLVITHASNYYATLPHQIPAAAPPPTPPLPPPRRTYQRANRKDDFCDLFNLLEQPTSPVKHRRKRSSAQRYSRRQRRASERKTSPCKDTSERPAAHSTTCPVRQRPRDTSAFTEKTKKTNEIYQRRTANKGFFRRVMRNYFCVSSTIANSGYSS